jgi:hypothetical protein
MLGGSEENVGLSQGSISSDYPTATFTFLRLSPEKVAKNHMAGTLEVNIKFGEQARYTFGAGHAIQYCNQLDIAFSLFYIQGVLKDKNFKNITVFTTHYTISALTRTHVVDVRTGRPL